MDWNSNLIFKCREPKLIGISFSSGSSSYVTQLKLHYEALQLGIAYMPWNITRAAVRMLCSKTGEPSRRSLRLIYCELR